MTIFFTQALFQNNKFLHYTSFSQLVFCHVPTSNFWGTSLSSRSPPMMIMLLLLVTMMIMMNVAMLTMLTMLMMMMMTTTMMIDIYDD